MSESFINTTQQTEQNDAISFYNTESEGEDKPVEF